MLLILIRKERWRTVQQNGCQPNCNCMQQLQPKVPYKREYQADSQPKQQNYVS